MKTIIENPDVHYNRRTMVGAIILVIGSILLIDQLNLFFIPDWLFSWPMILIAIGTYSGYKHHFRKPSSVIMILLGIAFLFTNNIPDAGQVIWPLGIIALGSWMVFRHKSGAVQIPFEKQL